MEPTVLDTTGIEPEVWDDRVRGDVSFRVVLNAGRTPTSGL